MLAANTILQNRYRIIRQLGEGGMGTVYEAIDQRLSSVVAIKQTVITTAEARQGFEREASLLANLRHRSLPNVTDHFQEDEAQYLVMQFIPGEDLAKLLELRKGPLAIGDVMCWADVILQALEYLHSHKPPILHRDIKPANLKLTPEGDLFLIDFGLSKGAAGQMSTLVTSRSVKGYTPAYSPLEQIHGGGTDLRSDLYSLAATIYHLVTNVPPVDAPTRFNALDELQADPLSPADQVNPEVPPALTQVLTQTLAMNRRNRPANATAMRQMLRQVQAPNSSAPNAVVPQKESAPITPTQPAPTTQPLAATRQTDASESLDIEPNPPTIKEVPNLIKRPAVAPETTVTTVSTDSLYLPKKTNRKRTALLMISIGLLLMITIAAVVLVRRLIKSNPASNQTAAVTSPPASSETPVKPVDVPPKKSFSGDFNVGKALELVYGSYDSGKKYAKWKITREDIGSLPKDEQSIGIRPGIVYTASSFSRSFTQGDTQKFIVITETVPAHYDCHACAPIVGGAIFSQQGGNWQLDVETKALSVMGSFGSAPKGQLVKIGPDRYGIVFHPGTMNQGVSEEELVILGEFDGALREMLAVGEYSGDNTGNCGEGSVPAMMPCWKYSSKMDFVAGSNPDYYDLKVVTIGSKEDNNGNIKKISERKNYTFNGGKYSLSK